MPLASRLGSNLADFQSDIGFSANLARWQVHGDVRLRLREIKRQVCAEMGVTIINGALSRDYVHRLVEIPPHVSSSGFARRGKG